MKPTKVKMFKFTKEGDEMTFESYANGQDDVNESKFGSVQERTYIYGTAQQIVAFLREVADSFEEKFCK